MAANYKPLQFTRQLSDPIWGAFPITGLEEEVLQIWDLSRLNHIKQMGLAFLDYPSLTHTRLEHSLGVMYVADQLFKTIRETSRNGKDFSPSEIRKLFSPINQQAVRVAALLHDIGHPPFSHAVELTFIRYPSLLRKAQEGLEANDPMASLFESYSHEAFTGWTISNSKSLGDTLRKYFGETSLLVQEIADLAIGKAKRSLAPFNAIISGDFDADRIDYLIRDNRHSGFSIGLSPDELYDAVHIRRGEEKTATGAIKPCYEVYIDRNALPFVNSVLAARERLINRVHLAPAGRSATQMLTKFLFEDLSAISAGRDLASTIVRLHQRCTDYTFFGEIRNKIKIRKLSKSRGINNLIETPSTASVWEEEGHLSFMRMQPCLRLLAYISASAKYDSPSDLVFSKSNGKDFIFLEPSSRPTPKFSLLVDYGYRHESPSLDFIASTENRQGRAILSQSLSNLDIFSYSLSDLDNPHPTDLSNYTKPSCEEYLEGLTKTEAMLGRHAAEIAHRVKERRKTERDGMLPLEFLLATLYFLDRNVQLNFKGSRSIYVYSAEYFINHFLSFLVQLNRGESLLPKEFLLHSRYIDSNRVFSDIQRLNVFGLVETRQRTILHVPGSAQQEGLRRTREGVYGTREDFRIGQWGKHYVEREIRSEELLNRVRILVESRQNKARPHLDRMASAYPHDIGSDSATQPEPSRIALLKEFYEEARKTAEAIRSLGGCMMIFRRP